MKLLVGEGSWIIIGQLLSAGGALVLVAVLTGLVDASVYGELTLGLTITALFGQLLTGGVVNAVARYYSVAAEVNSLSDYMSDVYRLALYTALVVGFIGYSASLMLFYFEYQKYAEIVAVTTLYAQISGYVGVFSGILNAARKRALVALHSGFDAWFKILVSFLIITYFDFSVAVVIFGYCISGFLVAISLLFFSSNLKGLELSESLDSKSWLREMYVYSLPFSLWGGFTWLQQVSDRWALRFFEGDYAVGGYAVVYQLGYVPIMLISNMVVMLVAPILFQVAGDAKNSARVSRAGSYIWMLVMVSLLLTFMASVVAYLFHDFIFTLVVSDEYREWSYLLCGVVFAGGLFASGQILTVKLMGEFKVKNIAVVKIVTGCLGVLLNLGGAYLAGVDGVVISMVVFSVIYFLWVAVISINVDASDEV